MKKLSSTAQQNIKILTDAQMKNVLGGQQIGGTCAAIGSFYTACDISLATAQQITSESGGRWCCDSCLTSTGYAVHV